MNVLDCGGNLFRNTWFKGNKIPKKHKTINEIDYITCV